MNTVFFLKISAILWIIWGAMRVFTGIIIIASDTQTGIEMVVDSVSSELLTRSYPEAVGGIIQQTGWNITWFGIVAIVSAIFIWKKSITAIVVASVVGGFSSLGDTIFLATAGYISFFPSTVMLMIALFALILSIHPILDLKDKRSS